ncbi:rhomboid family intramembrane serine protease [Streptomyces sp. NRRL F-5126]|uniref:rhomboid family intramembrane serine protease n=1 Tax=Streptomyces sp. NRRL F-5126 TaxID=1463857 RepID=UPI0006912DC9|nr:rhomboid family intramembrane serine protease [Streptomyces sp. NRRL F-5126]
MVAWVALLWILLGIDDATGGSLNTLGITPRRPGELLDIVPAAFLHGGVAHLASNTLPLLVLGFLVALGGLARFFGIVATVTIVSGLGVWLTAPGNSVTIGASGVIFGLLAYLVVTGFVNRRVWEVVLGLVVLAVYGSILLGALPGTPGISWQAHAFGLVGGVLAAFLFRRQRRTPPGTLPPGL